MLNSLCDQSVLQVGLGESGLACARWMLAQGSLVTVIDDRENPPGLEVLKTLHPDVRVLRSFEELRWNFQRVVVSPGLAPGHPMMQSVIACARKQNAQIDCELDLFTDALDELAQTKAYHPQVIGITGTNGKTTTTRMVECLASFAGKKAIAAGNISPAALDALRQQLAADDLPDVWVLELSSFQLHWIRRLKLHAATVLNITQDHLDWHADMQAYAAAKLKIFFHAATCVLNRDEPALAQAKLPEGAPVFSFGTSIPLHANDFGLVREGGMFWLAQLLAERDSQTVRRGKQQDEAELHQKLLMPVEALQISGLHNAANALAALALCRALDWPMAKLLHGLRNYRGEPHRVEHIAQIDGVDYFDDSKGTNVGATVAALNGLGRPTVLIAGGDGKGQDFSPLIEPVADCCKHVVLIGTAANVLADVLSQTGVSCSKAHTLLDAVHIAASCATAGDCILLSPACASLDMFKNYVHRAEVFVQAVRSLAADRGQPC